MGAKFEFQNYDEENKRLKNGKGVNILVKAIRYHRPGGPCDYRFEVEGKSLVFGTDIEHVDGIDQETVMPCNSADVLIHDAQYMDDELKDKQGWKHNSFSLAIQIARSAHVNRLIFTTMKRITTTSYSRGREW